MLAPFIEHARKASRGPARRTARTSAGRQRGGEVRAWAKDHGITVSARGRIPVSVLERYQAAAQRTCMPRSLLENRQSRPARVSRQERSLLQARSHRKLQVIDAKPPESRYLRTPAPNNLARQALAQIRNVRRRLLRPLNSVIDT